MAPYSATAANRVISEKVKVAQTSSSIKESPVFQVVIAQLIGTLLASVLFRSLPAVVSWEGALS